MRSGGRRRHAQPCRCRHPARGQQPGGAPRCGCQQVRITAAARPAAGPPPGLGHPAVLAIEIPPPSCASPPGGALEKELAGRRKVRARAVPEEAQAQAPCRSAEGPHAPCGPRRLATVRWCHLERSAQLCEPRAPGSAPSCPAWRHACTRVACMAMTPSLQSRGLPAWGPQA